MKSTNNQPNRAKSVGLATAGFVAGVALAGAGIAAAATSSTPTPNDTSSAAPSEATPPAFHHGGSSPVRDDEKSVSASDTEKLTAAALKAVPGATVFRVETDAGDGAYEAHLTKADGSLATVKFDKNMAVIAVQDGMGTGDPGRQGDSTGAPTA